MARIELVDCGARLLGAARSNAKKADVPFALDECVISEIWKEQGGRCAVSGLDFTDEQFATALVKRPFAPSIDRIVPRDGYVPKNVRIVCVCANFSMNEWGLETLVRLADAVLDFHRSSVVRDRLVAIWRARQEGRIAEAVVAAARMSGQDAIDYRRRIAGLRRALTLSPQGLRLAAERARATLREGPQGVVVPDDYSGDSNDAMV